MSKQTLEQSDQEQTYWLQVRNNESSNDASSTAADAATTITVDSVENLNTDFFLSMVGSEEKENRGENIHYSDRNC